MTRTIEDLSAEIDRRWEQLGARPSGETLSVIDLPDWAAGTPIFLGLGADGARLLIAFEKDKHRIFREETQASGLQLRVRQLEERGDRRWYLDIVCPDQDVRWLFSTFVADVVLRITRAGSEDATAIARRCYLAWRAMFSAPARRLGLKQLAGLYGELYILERLLRRSPTVAGRWRGPLREPHDFVSPSLDVEVKTTLSDEDAVIHVHGLEQLSCEPTERLWLAHVRVAVPSDEGDSVPAIAARVRHLDSSGRIPSLLRSAGYHEEHAQTYESLTFSVVNEEWYEVDDQFPAVRANAFVGGQSPTGVSDISYRLDLAVVSTPTIGASEVEAGLDVVAG